MPPLANRGTRIVEQGTWEAICLAFLPPIKATGTFSGHTDPALWQTLAADVSADILYQGKRMALTIQPDRRSAHHASTADVQEELICAIFDRLLPLVVFGCAAQVIATAWLASSTGDAWLWSLTCAMIAIAIVRIAVVAAFYRRGKTHVPIREGNHWEAVYGTATLFYAAAMGASTLHNIANHFDYTIICVMGTICLSSGVSARVGMRPWLVQLSGVIMFSALGVAAFRTGLPAFKVAAFLCVLYSIAYCQSVRTQYDMLVEQLRRRRQFRTLAEQDTLTGLANRRHFQKTLDILCRAEAPFAILYIDLDRFKHVNDTYGHAAGDALLLHVAERLTHSIRATDLLARLGGDEFAILQSPLPSRSAAEALARNINRSIAAPFDIEGHEIKIGASVGIQLASHGRHDPNRLLSNADEALYRVKQSGGGAFSCT